MTDDSRWVLVCVIEGDGNESNDPYITVSSADSQDEALEMLCEHALEHKKDLRWARELFDTNEEFEAALRTQLAAAMGFRTETRGWARIHDLAARDCNFNRFEDMPELGGMFRTRDK